MRHFLFGRASDLFNRDQRAFCARCLARAWGSHGSLPGWVSDALAVAHAYNHRVPASKLWAALLTVQRRSVFSTTDSKIDRLTRATEHALDACLYPNYLTRASVVGAKNPLAQWFWQKIELAKMLRAQSKIRPRIITETDT